MHVVKLDEVTNYGPFDALRCGAHRRIQPDEVVIVTGPT